MNVSLWIVEGRVGGLRPRCVDSGKMMMMRRARTRSAAWTPTRRADNLVIRSVPVASVDDFVVRQDTRCKRSITWCAQLSFARWELTTRCGSGVCCPSLEITRGELHCVSIVCWLEWCRWSRTKAQAINLVVSQ